MVLQERVAEAQRLAKVEMKDLTDKNGKKRKNLGDNDDDSEQATGAVRKRIKNKGGKKRGRK